MTHHTMQTAVFHMPSHFQRNTLSLANSAFSKGQPPTECMKIFKLPVTATIGQLITATWDRGGDTSFLPQAIPNGGSQSIKFS